MSCESFGLELSDEGLVILSQPDTVKFHPVLPHAEHRQADQKHRDYGSNTPHLSSFANA